MDPAIPANIIIMADTSLFWGCALATRPHAGDRFDHSSCVSLCPRRIPKEHASSVESQAREALYG
jgi:hypothetical protein